MEDPFNDLGSDSAMEVQSIGLSDPATSVARAFARFTNDMLGLIFLLGTDRVRFY